VKSSTPPPAPDPGQTSNNQARYNQQSAQAQQGMNMVNQVTPYGSLTYQQSGTNPDGTPRYTATTSLSQQQQSLLDQQGRLQGGMGSAAEGLLGRVNTTMATPFQLGNEATESRLMDLGRRRLDPMLQQQWQSQEADLLNRGVVMGSEAYQRQREQFDQRQNDAYNQLLLTGRQQAGQEMLTERNQPYQELAALMGGSAPQMPQFQSTPQVSVASPDYQGAVNTQYQGQMNAYKQQQQNKNAMLGGLFGLVGTGVGAVAGGPMGAQMGAQAGRAFGGWASGG
jgi:hypothetical protein